MMGLFVAVNLLCLNLDEKDFEPCPQSKILVPLRGVFEIFH